MSIAIVVNLYAVPFDPATIVYACSIGRLNIVEANSINENIGVWEMRLLMAMVATNYQLY